MKLTTDFECGSGRLTRTGPSDWRLDTVADPFGYNRYFCVEIDASEERDALDLSLEVYPDPALGAASHFMTHFPSQLWKSPRGDLRWVPLRESRSTTVEFHKDHIVVRLRVDPGSVFRLATNAPLQYSQLQEWIERIRENAAGRLSIHSLGKSHEGRDVPILRFNPRDENAPRLLILAGQHASEHSGPWACRGIVEYLCSSISEAVSARSGLEIVVIPMLNPDGNVRGYSGGGAERLAINNSLDFAGAAHGALPQTHENRLLWAFLERFRPDCSLHFHGYMGWRSFADHPYDGLYALPPERLGALGGLAGQRQRAVLDRLRFETPAYSAHFPVTGELGPATLEWQMAEMFGTASVLYEINVSSVGPGEQFRRGPQVFAAVAGALLKDCATPETPGPTP